MPYNTESIPIVLARPAQNLWPPEVPPPLPEVLWQGQSRQYTTGSQKGRLFPFSQSDHLYTHSYTQSVTGGQYTPPPHSSVWALHQHQLIGILLNLLQSLLVGANFSSLYQQRAISSSLYQLERNILQSLLAGAKISSSLYQQEPKPLQFSSNRAFFLQSLLSGAQISSSLYQQERKFL